MRSYYVASPEACAAILWKTADAAPQATEALLITSHELAKLDIVDEVIPEPLGGAHSDPITTSQTLKAVLMRHMHVKALPNGSTAQAPTESSAPLTSSASDPATESIISITSSSNLYTSESSSFLGSVSGANHAAD